MSNAEQPKKQPSHVLFRVERLEDGQKHWEEVGAAWPTKDGGFTVDLGPMGKLAARPRELLEKMRAERKKEPTQEVAQEISPK